MNAIKILSDIIKNHTPNDIWKNSPIIGYRLLGNTNRGEIGEKFVIDFLNYFGIRAKSKGNRTSKTDMQVENIKFEIKTASLGNNGTFQFNHVQFDRDYNYLLCVGICPDQVVFSIWRKGEVAEGEAGKLVRMAEGQSVTFKLTKRLDEMLKIDLLVPKIKYINNKNLQENN